MLRTLEYRLHGNRAVMGALTHQVTAARPPVPPPTPPGPLSGRPVFRCCERSSTVSTGIELSWVHSLIKSPPLAQLPVQPEPPAQNQAPRGAPPQLPSWSSTGVVGGAHHSSREDFDIYVVPAH